MPRKGERRLSLPPLTVNLTKANALSEVLFHTFGGLPTLKQSASACVIHRKRIRAHIIVKDELSILNLLQARSALDHANP